MVEDGRGNRVANAGRPQVVRVVAKQMLPRGRQRMGEQTCFLLDSHIHIVRLKIAVSTSGIKMRRIETAPGPQADFLFGVDFHKRPHPGPPIVIEHSFPPVIVPTRLRFQTGLRVVADPQ